MGEWKVIKKVLSPPPALAGSFIFHFPDINFSEVTYSSSSASLASLSFLNTHTGYLFLFSGTRLNDDV